MRKRDENQASAGRTSDADADQDDLVSGDDAAPVAVETGAQEIPGADDALSDDGVQAAAGEAAPRDDRADELERTLTLERDKYLRLAAEFDNYRKRMLKERLEAESRGQSELVRGMLDVLDDISRFAHVDPATTDSATVVQGVELVERKLDKMLRAAGLEPVNPVNEHFDPSMHEAVATQAAQSDEEDGTIAQVYQVGYRFKGQLLRPARVVVRQYTRAS